MRTAIILMCIVALTSCKGFLTITSGKTKKASGATELSIIGATKKNATTITLNWGAATSDQTFEITISSNAKSNECIDPIVSFKATGGSTDIKVYAQRLYACVFLLDANGNQVKAASNNGYLIDVGSLSSSTTSSAIPTSTPAPGSVDSTFGLAGISVPVTADTDHGSVRTIALTASGNLYVGTNNVPGAPSQGLFRVFKFTSNGSLDPSFNALGTPGYQDYNYTGGLCGACNPGGRIIGLMAASLSDSFYTLHNYGDSGNSYVELTKNSGDGALDAAFGTVGRLLVESAAGSFRLGPLGSGSSGLGGIAQLSNGTTFAMYISGTGSWASGLSIVKYDSAFSVDMAYAGTGQFTYSGAGNRNPAPLGFNLQSDGTIHVPFCNKEAAGCTNAFGNMVADGKITSAGALDGAFGTGGVVDSNFGGYANGYAMRASLVQADGKIILVGSENTGAIATQTFTLVRLNSNGSLDGTFGTAGIASTLPSLTGSQAIRAVLQSDGKIIVAGNVVVAGINNIGIARYNSDGSFDSAFGTGGVYTFGYTDGPSGLGDILMTADNKTLYFAGHATRAGFTNQVFVGKINL